VSLASWDVPKFTSATELSVVIFDNTAKNGRAYSCLMDIFLLKAKTPGEKLKGIFHDAFSGVMFT